jgi:hypothetical protein
MRYGAHSFCAWSDGEREWADGVGAGDGDDEGVSGGGGGRVLLMDEFGGINTKGVVGGVMSRFRLKVP